MPARRAPRSLPGSRLLDPIRRGYPAPVDDCFHRAQREDSPPVVRHDDLLCGQDVAPLLMAASGAGESEPCRRRIEITRSGVRRGVPRSPNRYLDQLRGRRQVNLGGRQVQSDCLLDTAPRLLFRLAGRSATRQLRADRGVALSFRVVLQDHAEPHACSIPPRLSGRCFRALADCR